MRKLSVALAVMLAMSAVGTAEAVKTPPRTHVAHRDVEPVSGTQANPMFVYNGPVYLPGGGVKAWADYGLHQILHASKPSPDAHAICQLDSIGDSIWVSGGMLLPGRYDVVAKPKPWRTWGGEVEIMVSDSDGTHGGPCSPLGLALKLAS